LPTGFEASKNKPRVLLVLAASVYQLLIIRRAQALGHRVIALDNRPDNPGHRIADVSVICDTRDVAGVIKVAREAGIDGVIAAATDVAVATAAAVGASLGLPAPSARAATTLTNKIAFRSFQRKIGLPAPAWALEPQAIEDADAWLVKPAVLSGARGVRIVTNRADLAASLEEARTQSLDGTALIEEMIPGSQHSLEGIIVDGRVRACLITDRQTAQPPYTATTGHRVPSMMPAQSRSACVDQIEKVFAALDYRDGPFDADVVDGSSGPILIEVTPRAGGNALMQLLTAATDFQYVDYLIAQALGMDFRPPQDFSVRPAAAVILCSAHPGRLTYRADRVSALAREPWCISITLDVETGEDISAFTDGRARFGELVVVGDALANLETRIEEAKACLEIKVE